MLTELPRKVIVYLTSLCNGVMRTGQFPKLWKVSQIIMMPKPRKSAHDVTSYGLISLLPVMSKIFEKILLKRLVKALFSQSVNHQFGFRKNHATGEQFHRLCNCYVNVLVTQNISWKQRMLLGCIFGRTTGFWQNMAWRALYNKILPTAQLLCYPGIVPFK